MEKDFDHTEEDHEAIERFEKMLKNSENLFFELNTFEYLISHYMEKGNYAHALEACTYALEQYPYSCEVMMDKAQLLANGGQLDEAWALMEKAETIQPTDSDVVAMKSYLLINGREFETAMEYLQRMGDFLHERDVYYFHYGVCLGELGKVDECVYHLKKALRINPNHEEAYYELTNFLDIHNLLESNLSFYQEIVDKEPYCHTAWYNMGMAYSRLFMHEEAAFAFDFATVTQETNPSAWFNLGNAYMNLDLYEKAEHAYRKSLEHDTADAELYTYLAASLEKQEKFNEAIVMYKKALKEDPLYADAWYGVGFCLNEQSKWFESLHFLKKAVELEKDNSEFWATLADSEYKLGNSLSSLEAYEQANLLDPSNVDVWLNWSFIFFEMGDYEKSTNVIRAGIDDLPNEADLYYRATIYLIYAGNYKEAFLYLENALILDFESHSVLFEFFTDIEIQKALYKIIDQYKK